jgi:predicted MPP superfamily phosphohydrolase
VSFIFTIIGSMLLLDAIWWWTLARQTDTPFARALLGVFMFAQMVCLVWLIASRLLQTGWDRWLPKFATSALFIWHFLGLGLFSLIGLALIPLLLVAKSATGDTRHHRGGPDISSHEQQAWSRREVLGLAAALAPPLFTLTLTGVAMSQLNNFRIRRFVIPIPELPGALDGTTIAQVSDMHVGRFTSGRVLEEMVSAINALQADLVLLTGDLINDALADLDHGLALVRKMESRFGLYLIEGNHDLIENPSEFERRVRSSGIPFLLDQSTVVAVNGAPIQLLGLSWTRHHAKDHDEEISRSVRTLLRQRQSDAFSILLAHHPHAFDAAAEAGMPLTLSGHTHGGQLMLNEALGFGPAMFRYWSGLYMRGGSKLIVSNGVGNWFPLRVNAPAEIIHITLRQA